MQRIVWFCLLVLAASSGFSQQVLLFSEDFEQASITFAYDSGWANSAGPNRWIVNSEYDGGGIYPNTTNQDSTVAGAIYNAPYSSYLHIHNENAAVVANSNYDPQSASDRFAFTKDGFCTLGINDVTFAFFYLCGGDTNAYGEVYYSKEGGPWVQTGTLKYYGETSWAYETITDTAFANSANLRFGFRWVNDSSGLGAGMSFGIDDIICVGTVDTALIELTIPMVSSDSICRGENVQVQWQTSIPLCDGMYRIELSDSNGVFQNPTSLKLFSISNMQTTDTLDVLIPTSVTPGSCYKFRFTRIFPSVIEGMATGCVEVRTCPNLITTLQPAVLLDPDTVCAYSALSVPFTSTGVYNGNNIYFVELSDASGNFANADTIGTFQTRDAFNPAAGDPPGEIACSLPGVFKSCGYYIRIVSSNPQAIGSAYGPFCVKQCDILTSDGLDVHACIHDTTGFETTINVDIHTWDSTANYFPGNRFLVQVLDMSSLHVVNEGGLGMVTSSVSGTMNLSVPGLNGLLSLGIVPGVYYMRIIADSSSQPWNAKGSLIRLTIGAISDSPPVIIPDKPVYCNSEVAELLISPFDSASNYEWQSSSLNNGLPLIWEFNPLRVDFSGASQGTHSFKVREISYGCIGSFSALVTISIKVGPDITLSGDLTACLDSVYSYSVPLVEETYYEWSVSNGTILDSSANEVTVSFTFPGSGQLSLYVINVCGVFTPEYGIVVGGEPATITGLPAVTCGDAEPFSLDGSPEGGTFSGSGIITNVFTPSEAGLGVHEITYEVTDHAGCMVKSVDTVSVEMCEGVGALDNGSINRVYPNPVAQMLYVELDPHSNLSLLQLYDVTGSLVNSNAMTKGTGNIAMMDISHLPNGVYMLRVNQEQVLTKVVVLK